MPKRAFQDITNTTCKHFRLTVYKKDHRIKLLRWLFEVCLDFSYSSYTFASSVLILDAYTARAGVDIEEYQLTGTTSLFIAAKLEERYPKRLSDYSFVTDESCSPSLIIEKEREILELLDYELGMVLPHSYLEKEYLKQLEILRKKEEFLVMFNCAVAAHLEESSTSWNPLGIFMESKKLAESVLEGSEPTPTMKFYINECTLNRKDFENVSKKDISPPGCVELAETCTYINKI